MNLTTTEQPKLGTLIWLYAMYICMCTDPSDNKTKLKKQINKNKTKQQQKRNDQLYVYMKS